MREERAGSSTSHREIDVALRQISAGDAGERVKGAEAFTKMMTPEPVEIGVARVVRNITAKESFEPLLAAVERETDDQVKIKLLEALCSTSNAGEFEKPANLTEKLEQLIFQQTDRAVVEKAAMAIYYFGIDFRISQGDYVRNYFVGLRGKAEKSLGKDHVVPKEISSVLGYLTSLGWA